MHPYPPPAPKSNLGLIIILCVVGGVVVIGILAAVAIPSFLSYQKQTKRSDSEVMLDAIEKGLKNHVMEKGAFPVGTAGPTPPVSCCEFSPDRKCPPDPALFEGDPIWDALDFDVMEPSYFRYAYDSPDGQTVTVRAIGDLDCDMNEVEYVLDGVIEGGRPVFMKQKPAQMD